MACCWLVTLDHEWNWCNWCRFRFSAIFGRQMVNPPTLHFAASVLSDWKKFTKKIHCNCSNEIKETNHRVDHLLDEILGICDSLLFDFLSENSAVEDLIAVYPMYRGVFLQHCILVVWSLLLLYGSPNDRCFFVVSLHFGCTWHSGCIFHVCSFQLDDWCIISSDGDDWKWGFYPDKISLMLMLNVNKCIQIC